MSLSTSPARAGWNWSRAAAPSAPSAQGWNWSRATSVGRGWNWS